MGGEGLDYLVLWMKDHCVQREFEKVLSIFIFFEKQNLRLVLAGSGEEVKLGENLLGCG